MRALVQDFLRVRRVRRYADQLDIEAARLVQKSLDKYTSAAGQRRAAHEAELLRAVAARIRQVVA